MSLAHHIKALGPGFVLAATGLGAGDMVAAAAAGAKHGSHLLWAIALGALLKWGLTEGLARWQLLDGSSVLSAWHRYLPRWMTAYFLVYLFIWAFLVAAALMAACGLAAHALLPQLSIFQWAAVHSVLAAALVLLGHYRWLESAMKGLIGLMFLTVTLAIFNIDLTATPILQPLLIPGIPENGNTMILAVTGGVGGSVTLLCYGYWMRERNWRTADDLTMVRIDLAAAYVMTALFAMGIMLIAANAAPRDASGQGLLLAMADVLGRELGSPFRLLFLAGFWAAVFSSMLGVWQGVPYLFADVLAQRRNQGQSRDMSVDDQGTTYRATLLYLALPPLLLLTFGKPLWLVLVYSIAGAFFMPFLAMTLLYLNNRRLAPARRNRLPANLLLSAALLLFMAVGLNTLMR